VHEFGDEAVRRMTAGALSGAGAKNKLRERRRASGREVNRESQADGMRGTLHL